MNLLTLTEPTTRRGVLALVLLAGLVYTNALGGSFIWGDDEYFYIDLPLRAKEPESRQKAHGAPESGTPGRAPAPALSRQGGTAQHPAPAGPGPAWMLPVKFAFTHDLFAYYPEPGQLHHYRPVAILAYCGLARVFGLEPFGLHLASVAMHALAGVLVFLLILEFAEMPVAWLTAALFLVHPLHVEAVAWMSAFSEVLAGALVLLSLLLLLMARRGPNQCGMRSAEFGVFSSFRTPHSTFRIGLPLALSFVVATLTLLTKETALALPVMAALFVGWRAWPFFAIAGGTLVIRALAIGPSLGPQAFRSPGECVRIMAAVVLHYAKLLVWPWPLAPEYDLLHPSAAAWVVFLVLVALAGWLAYRHAWVRLPLMLVFVPLAPALAAAANVPARFLAPDRNAYLAVLGVAWLIAYAASSECGRRKAECGMNATEAQGHREKKQEKPFFPFSETPVVRLCVSVPLWRSFRIPQSAFKRAGSLMALAVLSVWSILSVFAIGHWRNPEALWTHTLQVTPTSKGALMNLTYEYFVTMRFAEADRLLGHGLALRPKDPDYLAARAEIRKVLPLSRQPRSWATWPSTQDRGQPSAGASQPKSAPPAHSQP